MGNQMKQLDPIRFEFDERKAAAAASLLLKLEGGQMPYMRLIKLLYLADRESLIRFGRPISGDRYFSMKLGPVLSRVLDLIKDLPGETGSWAAHIERKGRYDVRLKDEPDLGPLSQAEIEILKGASDLCKTLDQWCLSKFTHLFPEWQDPAGSAVEILPEEILRAAGKKDEDIEEDRQEALEKAYFDSIFGK